MASKILNLVALSSLAILACSFGPSPVNAISLDSSANHARSVNHHNILAKKKRADTRRCKTRSATSSVATSTSASASVTTSKAVAAVVTPKTSAKATPTPTPTPAAPATGGGGKAGISYFDVPGKPITDFTSWKVSAVYNWDVNKPAGVDAAGLEYVPMLHDTKAATISKFTAAAKAGYAKHALYINEPEISGQASVDPGTAISVWWQAMQPLAAKGYTLISPAVTSAPQSIPWLQQFMNGCNGCSVGAVALHWYGTDADDFIAYVKKFHTTFNKPVWVTEFACQSFTSAPQCSQSQTDTFMAKAIAFLDSASYVEKYFYFGMFANAPVSSVNWLMSPEHTLTALGHQYLGK